MTTHAALLLVRMSVQVVSQHPGYASRVITMPSTRIKLAAQAQGAVETQVTAE